MDETLNGTEAAHDAMNTLNEALRSTGRTIEWLSVRRDADPDGQLAETAAMLRLKRGCRR